MPLDLTSFLFLAHRLPKLTKPEHQLIPVVALAFWPGGTRLDRVRFEAQRVHDQGVGAARIHCARAIHRLARRGVLVPTGPRFEYALELEAAAWEWTPAERYTSAIAELHSLSSPEAAWGTRAPLAAAIARLIAAMDLPAPTPHPNDPAFGTWLDQIGELADHLGDALVLEALSEAALDPRSILPPTPRGFAVNLYGLVARAKRRAPSESSSRR
jgi:hypothetical protein